jgi:acyl-CoA synthetase (AMP-forming)/AMP-acid ligase II
MGEIEINSPSVIRGYIDHASDALLPSTGDAEFWWPTGDVGLFCVAPSGETHLFVVDRIRDMIKVKVSDSAKTKRESTHLGRQLLTSYRVG